jgi:hypothetical protein
MIRSGKDSEQQKGISWRHGIAAQVWQWYCISHQCHGLPIASWIAFSTFIFQYQLT